MRQNGGDAHSVAAHAGQWTRSDPCPGQYVASSGTSAPQSGQNLPRPSSVGPPATVPSVVSSPLGSYTVVGLAPDPLSSPSELGAGAGSYTCVGSDRVASRDPGTSTVAGSGEIVGSWGPSVPSRKPGPFAGRSAHVARVHRVQVLVAVPDKHGSARHCR
jgi:hypothetical protein